MNIISFEERTFEGIAAKFEYFVQRVDNLCRRHGEKKIDEWMDARKPSGEVEPFDRL